MAGSDVEGEIWVIGMLGHLHFLRTLFMPKARAILGRPHPLVNAFLRAAMSAIGRRINII
ncbi:MAG: hypothetical protein M1132_05375 [Chloroflexi bacterium]|nr:hypothetical protein [Chloroflexota bacterium]